jgi:hypothetical protein
VRLAVSAQLAGVVAFALLFGSGASALAAGAIRMRRGAPAVREPLSA